MLDWSIVYFSGLVVVGMLLLYGGGHWLVSGAGGIAQQLRVAPLVIGLTVVAFGTSAPELFVSTISAWQGRMGVSIGNVLGSNVINIALILGLAAVILPAAVHRAVIVFDTPVMLATYVVLVGVALDLGAERPWLGGRVGRVEGAVLVLLLVVYVVALYRRAQFDREVAQELDAESAEVLRGVRPIPVLALMVVVGVAALAFGADVLVKGASWLAVNVFGAGERFVGITVVAFGTSLPELFTSITSLLRREMDISVGNIIGSNIFNSLMVIGGTALVRPIEIGITDYRTDFAVMVLVALVLYGFLLGKRRVPRYGGVVLLALYVGYVGVLVATRGA